MKMMMKKKKKKKMKKWKNNNNKKKTAPDVISVLRRLTHEELPTEAGRIPLLIITN